MRVSIKFEVWALNSVLHGAYNLEKDLNFSSLLEKSLNLVKVIEKYLQLISLLGLEISLKFTNCLRHAPFSVQLDYFAEENLGHPRCKNLVHEQHFVSVSLFQMLFLYLRRSSKSYPVTVALLQSVIAENQPCLKK